MAIELNNAKAFCITKLTDVIDEEVLQIVQTGLSERERIPLTILEERDSEWYRIGQVNSTQNYCDFCAYLRGKPGSRTDLECVRWVLKKAKDIVKTGRYDPHWFSCHVGLVGVAFPIVIDNKVVAVFLSCQKRLQGEDHKVQERVVQLSQKYKNLSSRKLMKLLRKIRPVTESGIAAFIDKLMPVIQHISSLGEQKYITEKRLQEELLVVELASYFEYSFEMNIGLLWDKLATAIRKINELTNTQMSMFFSSETGVDPEILHCRAAAGVSERLVSHLRLNCGQIKDFEDGAAFDTKFDNSQLFLEDMQADIHGCLGDYHLVSFALKNHLHGVFTFRITSKEGDERKNESAILSELMDMIKTHIQSTYWAKEREEYIQALETASREKEQFMSEMAHTLRAPAQSILSEAEYFIHCFPGIRQVDYEMTESATKITEEVGILKNKLDNYLLCADVEHKGIDYNIKENSLSDLIRDCVDQFKNIAERRSINIELSIDNIPIFRFDRDKIDIVFANLIDNAIKYSYGQKNVNVRGITSKNDVDIEIEDYGLGIRTEEMGKIFQKYYRAELRDRRRFIQGTGIGLTVARRIVEDHGGTIHVDSRPAGGSGHDLERLRTGEGFITTFTVSLPYARQV